MRPARGGPGGREQVNGVLADPEDPTLDSPATLHTPGTERAALKGLMKAAPLYAAEQAALDALSRAPHSTRRMWWALYIRLRADRERRQRGGPR